ncbi:MAG TPA: hypothetical protein DEH25_16380 [Chloroflexi bacterium]|nr:hypothetical protein [Chloroflexota bacterium]
MKHKFVTLLFLMFILLLGCTTAPMETSAPPQGTESVVDTPTPEEAAPLKESPAPETTSPRQTKTETPSAGDPIKFENLPFDEFLEESWFSIMRRDPELLTELGLSETFGVGNDQLTDISEPYRLDTYALYAHILEVLQTYERAALIPEQQLNYDIYAYYLEDTLRGQEFLRYDYPITHFITGVQYQLINFFSDIHPIRSQQDAEDYITRLSQVDTKFEQVIDNMKLSEESGVITPRFILQWSMGDIRNMANASATSTVFYTTLSEKLAALSTMSSQEKNELLAAAEAEIENTVIPAYGKLAAYLSDLEKRAPTEAGVWQFPNGEAYYTYRVQHYTTTELTPEEIHQMGLDDLARIQAEMRLIFDLLGYPTDETLTQLFNRIETEGGTLYGREVVEGYEAIIADAKVRAAQVLDLQPKADVIVIPGASGGYYIGPAVDGSRPGAFYAAVSGAEPRYGMASLAYHEAVPGHHTQIALALEMDLPSFRRGSLFTAYVEGWALYAEKLMAETGVYATDPYGDLGRLQYEAFRAARLVADTGIHTQGWTFDQAVDFMLENTGMDKGMLQFEVARYIAWPAQALAYKMGMNKIVELRARAEEQLGEQFDLRQFHNLILGSGAVPLDILEQIMEDYIAEVGS